VNKIIITRCDNNARDRVIRDDDVTDIKWCKYEERVNEMGHVMSVSQRVFRHPLHAGKAKQTREAVCRCVHVFAPGTVAHIEVSKLRGWSRSSGGAVQTGIYRLNNRLRL
jgi:hypothetical protein